MSHLALGLLALISCNDSAEPEAEPVPVAEQADARPERGRHKKGQRGERPQVGQAAAADAAPSVAPGGGSGVLMVGIGVHIEPFGADPRKTKGGDYNNQPYFERHAAAITDLATTVEKYGGRLTVQAEDPFVSTAVKARSKVLANLEDRGHEIGLHMHEDVFLGQNSAQRSVDDWCTELKRQVSGIKATGVDRVEYFSGGGRFPGLLDALTCAGLDTTSDFKDKGTQQSPLEMSGVHPWRPSAGPRTGDLSGYAAHSATGSVVFLPEGAWGDSGYAANDRSNRAGGDAAYFKEVAAAINASLSASSSDKVNVFHITVHPGEFRDPASGSYPDLEAFLRNTVDPLVKSGRVQWATYSQMADAYVAWEKAGGTNPRGGEGAAAAGGSGGGGGGGQAATGQGSAGVAAKQAAGFEGYMTFAINVHDITYTKDSIETVGKLADLYEKYGVKGDFYFTGPVAANYQATKPDLVKRLAASGMGINYHVRPPHPAYPGFDGDLKGKTSAEVQALFQQYETSGLDETTGKVATGKKGGYSYVKSIFGKAPTVASAPGSKFQTDFQAVTTSMGARMGIAYHENNPDRSTAIAKNGDLYARPSDFSITRWASSGGGDPKFWWNEVEADSSFNPLSKLESELGAWNETRVPFVTSLVHENNIYRRGADPWVLIYYQDKQKKQTKSPPFDLKAQDASTARPPAQQQAFWTNYEAMVAYASQHMCVVTAEQIVALADKYGSGKGVSYTDCPSGAAASGGKLKGK